MNDNGMNYFEFPPHLTLNIWDEFGLTVIGFLTGLSLFS